MIFFLEIQMAHFKAVIMTQGRDLTRLVKNTIKLRFFNISFKTFIYRTMKDFYFGLFFDICEKSKHLFQIYFPIQGRKVREPIMFSDEEKLHGLLEQEKYEYVLDRACIQYEPDEPSYQKVTSITYQHVDMKTNFNLLR